MILEHQNPGLANIQLIVILEEVRIEQIAFPEAVSLGQLPKPKRVIITLKSVLNGLVKRYLVCH